MGEPLPPPPPEERVGGWARYAVAAAMRRARHAPAWADRADLESRALEALWRAALAWDPAGVPWRPFLARCVRNAALNWLRAERRSARPRASNARGDVPDRRPGPAEEAAAADWRARLRGGLLPLLALLTAREKEAVVRRVVEGLTMRGVAAAGGYSPARAQQLVRAGLARLRRHAAALFPEERW